MLDHLSYTRNICSSVPLYKSDVKEVQVLHISTSLLQIECSIDFYLTQGSVTLHVLDVSLSNYNSDQKSGQETD